MRRSLLVAVAGLLAAAALPASAGAATATASAAKPGAPAILHYDLDASAAPIGGRFPIGLTIAAPAGVKMDFKTIPKTCNIKSQAWGDCSPYSQIGKGTATVAVTTIATGAVRDVVIPVNVFRGDKGAVTAFAFVRDVPQPVLGTMNLTTGFSFTLLVPALIDTRRETMDFKRLSFDLGQSRNFKVKVVRGKGKHRKVRHKIVHRDLLRLPKTCPASGQWDASIGMTFTDGSTAVVPTPVACSAS